LLRHVRIDDDRINRNIREIAGLVRPCERTAVSSARYLKHVPGLCRRVSIEAANSRVAYRQICSTHGWIESDTDNRPIRQHSIVASNIYPVRLARRPGPQVKADPCICVVRAEHCDT